MNRRARRAAAKKSASSPKPSGAGTPARLYEAGLAHLRAGRYLDAQTCCQQALAADSNDPDAMYLMGLLSLDAKQYDHAAEWTSRAIQQDSKAEYLAALGMALQHQGRLAEALKALNGAIQLKTDDVGLWKARGSLCTQLKLPSKALHSFQRALELDPHNCDVAAECGMLLYRMGRLEEAHLHFHRCAELQPNVQTLYRRGRVLIDLGKPEQALADHQRAHALDPVNPHICNNTGVILRSLGREEDALQWFDRALALQPSSIEALNNSAVSLGQLQRFDEAFATYQRVKALDPDNAEIDWNVAILHLLTGNFAAGWTGREARWKRTHRQPYPEFTQPKWLGEEAVEGKTILVCSDEGLGDTIQFVRYVPMLAARGGRVILLVSDPLISLLSRLPGVSQCFPLSAFPALPAFDMHCPMSSLPLAFGTKLDTIPSAISYLPAPAKERIQIWEERLGPRHKLRVGLVWSGNPKHKNDHNRSISFQRFLRLLDGVDAIFVSLQKEPRPDDHAVLNQRADIIDLTADFTDFADTAALVSCLDLVITVDTSVAHLAGGLGCQTWILLPYAPDWRWMLDRDDSPWYPTVRLFRQTAACEYQSVLDRARTELLTLSADKQGEAPKPVSSLAAEPVSASGTAAQSTEASYFSGLGSTLLQQGRHEEALKAFDTAIEIAPDDAKLWSSRGGALANLNRLAEALQSYQRALELHPRHWDTACRIGVLLRALGRHEEALSHFNLCDELWPNHALTLRLRGSVLRDLKRFEEAMADSRRAHALDPANADICNDIGADLRKLGQHEAALEWFDRALKLRHDLAEALNNKASSLADLQRVEEALPLFDRSLKIRPNYLHALVNKALALGQIRRFDEAFAIYDHVKRSDPSDAGAEWNSALLHMLTGNFEAGWVGREARWKVPGLPVIYPKFTQPLWLGNVPVEGKTILIGADEGLGDTIQFARYVPMLASLGARVILFVQDPVAPLLSGLPGVAQCIPLSVRTLPAIDMHCPIGSLPLAFRTTRNTIPSATAYLPAPPKDRLKVWEDRLGLRTKPRVGLVWSGNPKHTNDHNRSIPLQALSRILDVEATFVSLQKEPRAHDNAALRERGDIIDVTAHLADFVETSALVSCLDLVITVDTSVAHLSGALGRPTWILLPYAPDYRWMLDRDDSPWYPTVRLFRQTESREYLTVVDRIRVELAALVSSRQLCRLP